MSFSEAFEFLYKELSEGSIAAWVFIFCIGFVLAIVLKEWYKGFTAKKQIDERRGCVCSEHGYCIHYKWDDEENLYVCSFPGCTRLTKVHNDKVQDTD